MDTEQQSALLNLQAQKKQLLKNIEQRYPEYYRLKYQPLNIPIKDAIDLLPDNETIILEYFYGRTAIYTFQIS